MKSDTVYKRAFNQVLEIVSAAPAGAPMPSENDLSSRMAVSRTTVRKVLRQLEARRIVGNHGPATGIGHFAGPRHPAHVMLVQ